MRKHRGCVEAVWFVGVLSYYPTIYCVWLLVGENTALAITQIVAAGIIVVGLLLIALLIDDYARAGRAQRQVI